MLDWDGGDKECMQSFDGEISQKTEEKGGQEMDGTGSKSCSVADFDIQGAKVYVLLQQYIIENYQQH